MPNKIDIVKLIEKNPITRLSDDYQNELITKIKAKFTNKEQQMFVASFYCFLNYSKNDFVVDLNDIWKWIGFARKDNAKRLLEKYFVKKVDYKILLRRSAEQSDSAKKESLLKGGYNKEQILMTVNTFKKFCLKAGTKKADEIHDYYIKLEELLQETINEETAELRNQLSLKNKEITEKDTQHKVDIKMAKHNTLIKMLRTKKCIYIGEIKEGKYIKIGSSKEVDERTKQGCLLANTNLIFLDNVPILLSFFYTFLIHSFLLQIHSLFVTHRMPILLALNCPSYLLLLFFLLNILLLCLLLIRIHILLIYPCMP